MGPLNIMTRLYSAAKTAENNKKRHYNYFKKIKLEYEYKYTKYNLTMAGSKERVVVVCHLRYNSWLSLPQGIQDPNRLHGGFFFLQKALHPSSQPTTPTPLTLLSTGSKQTLFTIPAIFVHPYGLMK